MALIELRRTTAIETASTPRRVDGFAAGDPLTVDVTVSDHGADAVTAAALTIGGQFALSITTTATAAGQILTAGQPAGTALLRFTATPAQTAALPNRWCAYAVTTTRASGATTREFPGIIRARVPVTRAGIAAVASVTFDSTVGTIRGLGTTLVRTATARDAGGTALPSRAITFVSSQPARATVAPASTTTNTFGAAAVTTTLVRGDLGTTIVTATCEGVQATLTVTLEEAVDSVTVAPAVFSVVAGATQQLTATTRDRFANVLTGRVVTWGTSAAGVATVSGAGLVTGVAAGSATITATSETIAGTSAATVTAASAVLLRYVPGDAGNPAPTFTRASVAYQMGAGGVLASVASGALRDAHYAGGVRHALVEPARTNYLLHASDLSQLAWNNTSGTVTRTPNYATAPDGTMTATRLQMSAGGAIWQYATPGGQTANRTWTGSLWIKGAVGGEGVRLDVTHTGVLGYPGQAIVCTTAWQRVSYTVAFGAGAATQLHVTINQTTANIDIQVWGLQAEESEGVTSEIPTGAATATRAADDLRFAVAFAPQVLAVYTRTRAAWRPAAGGGGGVALGTTTGAGDRVTHTWPSATVPQAVLATGASTATVNAPTIARVAGDVEEVASRVKAGGVLAVGQAVNDGAEQASADSAAVGIPGAWAVGTLLVGAASAGAATSPVLLARLVVHADPAATLAALRVA